MSEEVTEAPNWLAKLEEQREKRLKAKLGHEAGAGAPCQNCGDKCPGLDLHFWRKICKLCKCGKEDHDISDDDVYGFVQFQLLGNKPVKAKNIFLTGKKDAVTLDWTPKGANTDTVKKYLEELPDDMLPVKDSEAARVRKQRLQKQMPAHDIDATLCHALSPEEIQELEEYVAHIKKHSVGQGKIIQIPLLRSEQHKFGSGNTQFLSQHAPGQLASSQPVYLQASNLANNLHNLTIRDKPNRAAFLNSQLPNTPILNTIDEQNPETVGLRNENAKIHPNYSVKSLHQIVDNQNPISVGKTSDLKYQTHNNAGYPSYLNSENLPIHDAVLSENYYTQNPEFLAKMSQNPEYIAKLSQNPEYMAKLAQLLMKNPEMLANIQDPILSELYANQGPEFANLMARNIQKSDSNDRNIDNKYRVANPNINLVHSSQNTPIINQNSELLGGRMPLQNVPYDKTPNVPYGNQNLDTNYSPNKNFGNVPYQTENLHGYPQNTEQGQNLRYPNMDRSKNMENFHSRQPNVDQTSYPHGDMSKNPLDNSSRAQNLPQGKNMRYPGMDTSRNPLDNQNASRNPLESQIKTHGPNIHYPDMDMSKNPLDNFMRAHHSDPSQNMHYPNLDASGNPLEGQNRQSLHYPNLDASGNPINHQNLGQNIQYPILDTSGNPMEGQTRPNVAHGQGINYPNANMDKNFHPNQFERHDPMYPADGSYPNYPESAIQLPLTTSNVERHQEQFLKQDYPQMGPLSDSEFKNRIPIPVFNAENKINPLEIEQNLSSVGFIRDIDYGIPKKGAEADLVNSNVVPSCHKCKKLFEDGSIAVSADRTENLWHATCFNCHTCEQPLADLLYFYHKETDNIYCGRDYALLKGIPRCSACDELIFVKEYCLAEDRTFHIKHFCCFECDEPLAGKQYVMENNQPNCMDCYEKLKAERCTDCGYVIGPEEQGVSLQNLHWHASDNCFACKYCRKALLGGKMLLRNNNLFCSDVCFKTLQGRN